jgi:hypothetical protein
VIEEPKGHTHTGNHLHSKLLALLASVHCPVATCAQVKGISSVMGNSACGNNFDESGRNKDSHLRRVTMWFSEGCVQGLKTEFAGGCWRSGDACGQQLQGCTGHPV